jgi:hypothetical protein
VQRRAKSWIEFCRHEAIFGHDAVDGQRPSIPNTFT